MCPTADAITAIVRAVGEGDADQGRIAGGRGDGDRPCADEDERERAHELGDRAPKVVALHAGAS